LEQVLSRPDAPADTQRRFWLAQVLSGLGLRGHLRLLRHSVTGGLPAEFPRATGIFSRRVLSGTDYSRQGPRAGSLTAVASRTALRKLGMPAGLCRTGALPLGEGRSLSGLSERSAESLCRRDSLMRASSACARRRRPHPLASLAALFAPLGSSISTDGARLASLWVIRAAILLAYRRGRQRDGDGAARTPGLGRCVCVFPARAGFSAGGQHSKDERAAVGYVLGGSDI